MIVKAKRAYFIASLRGKEKYSKYYKIIYDTLLSEGFLVFSPIIDLTQKEVLSFKDYNFKQFYALDTHEIKQSNIFVAEISTSSANVGYEVAMAIAHRRPILLLRQSDGDSNTAPAFRGNVSKLITVITYNSSNLETKINNFLERIELGILVKRLPIGFTQKQVDYIESVQVMENEGSFNAAVRRIIDDATKIK